MTLVSLEASNGHDQVAINRRSGTLLHAQLCAVGNDGEPSAGKSEA